MAREDQRELSQQSHWDSRYSGERTDGLGEHEWFRSFADLKPFLVKHIPSASAMGPYILHLGCGTSDVTHGLYELGYTKQCNVDFSPVAIEAMSNKYSELKGVEWRVMDVRRLEFEDNSIDVAFDKGTLDAMLWGSLWDPEDEVKQNTQLYVDEVARCLKPGGKWVYVTFRQPHFLRPLLAREGVWDMTLEILGKEEGSLEYFGWILQKRLLSS